MSSLIKSSLEVRRNAKKAILDKLSKYKRNYFSIGNYIVLEYIGNRGFCVNCLARVYANGKLLFVKDGYNPKKHDIFNYVIDEINLENLTTESMSQLAYIILDNREFKDMQRDLMVEANEIIYDCSKETSISPTQIILEFSGSFYEFTIDTVHRDYIMSGIREIRFDDEDFVFDDDSMLMLADAVKNNK